MAKYISRKRQRRGVNFYEAYKKMKDRTHFGCMMVEMGDADAMISGLSQELSGNHQAGDPDHRHGRRGEKNCRHVYHAHKTRTLIPGRYNGQFQPNGGRTGRHHFTGGQGSAFIWYHTA